MKSCKFWFPLIVVISVLASMPGTAQDLPGANTADDGGKQRHPSETAAREVIAKGVAPFMQQKLDHAKHVLEGVVLQDFDRVSKNAQRLSLLSLDASWQVIQSPAYAQQSIEFRRAANALAGAAKDKNDDAAALAYIDLTMNCVNCHKQINSWKSPESESR